MWIRWRILIQVFHIIIYLNMSKSYWNIVESVVKHHETNKQTYLDILLLRVWKMLSVYCSDLTSPVDHDKICKISISLFVYKYEATKWLRKALQNNKGQHERNIQSTSTWQPNVSITSWSVKYWGKGIVKIKSKGIIFNSSYYCFFFIYLSIFAMNQ